MAGTLNDMLLGSAIESSKQAPDALKAMQTGSQLAQAAQNVQTQRAQIEAEKEKAFMQKVEKVGSLYETAGKLEGKGQRYMYETAIPNTIKALALDEYFPPATHAMLQSDPYAVSFLQSQIRQDPKKFDGIVTALQDQSGESLAKMFPEIKKFGALQQITSDASSGLKELEDAQKFAMSEAGKTTRAGMVQTGQNTRQTNAQEAAPLIEVKKKVGDIYAKFSTDGAAAAVSKLKKARVALKQLEDSGVNTGDLLDMGADKLNLLGKKNPKLKAMIDDVQGAIDMRASLADPNPTLQQVNDIKARAFDISLPNAQNINKLRSFITESEQKLDDSQKQFIQYNFMRPEEYVNPREVGKAAGKTYKVGGKDLTAAQAKAFYKANPQFLKDEKMKKELGL